MAKRSALDCKPKVLELILLSCLSEGCCLFFPREGKAAVSEVKKWMDETGDALDGRPFYPQSVQKIKKVSWRLKTMYQVTSGV
eukprot:4354503-Amphidinium_carterae.2